ncbi:MAG: energy-coupling factor transporter ATPase [Defluviitaleaceae bacterium]|nr:energy-coupling factor transporter ATPase [Defluviitaleaceae bacterium]MCL2835690.1 energy-coupling factor transporter ATPase [Defluviitaleaceae bacterium]
MKIIEADKVCFSYRIAGADGAEETLAPAVRELSLDIGEGEFVAVLGRNGSGKSTFAKLINALLTPSAGQLNVSGYSTAGEEHIWNIRQTAGMVFQNPDNQIVATIVEEDVAFGPENLGVPTAEIRARVDEALATVGMGDYALHSPHFLSGGQKQRVCIAGVLAMKPRIIILDEPTAMLDPIGRREVLAAVSRLNRQEGMTVLLITHYMEEAVMADRVVVMDKGAAVLQGTPGEVFLHGPLLRELGLNLPQITEIGARLAECGLPVKPGILTINEMADELCSILNSK